MGRKSARGPRYFLARYPILIGTLIGLMMILTASPTPDEAIAQASAEVASEELQLMKEEETVSIAVSHEQPISQAPSNVYVITDEDIRNSGSPDIPTILRRIPGMEVSQMTGAQFDVSVRGDNQARANKVLVLIDGRSVYLDLQGEVRWKTFPITLPEIKRIEVLKGPASFLYGFNAFDGVINIITKSPEEMKGTTLQLAGGELGTVISSAVHAGTQGKFGYRISGGQEQNDQWRNRDALAFRLYRFNLHTEYALPGEAKLLAAGGFVENNRYDGPIVENVSTQDKLRQGYAHLEYQRSNFFIRGYWTNVNVPSFIQANPLLQRFIQVTDINRSSQQEQEWNSYSLEAQHTLHLGANNRFSYGFNYRNNSFSSNFLDQFTNEQRLGFYVQDEWRLTQTLTAVAGVRYDLDTFIKPTTSPRFSLVYNPFPDHTFRASVGVAYRPPTVYENNNLSLGLVRLPAVPVPIATTVLTGNESLSPEQMISYELGYQGWYLKHRLRLRVDLFFNHLSDLITISRRPVAGASPEFINSGEGDIYGGEVGAEYLFTSWLTGFANFAQQEVGQNFVDTARRGVPRYKANAGLRGEWQNGVNVEALVHYVSSATYPINAFFVTAAGPPFNGSPPPDTRVGSYVLINLRGAYRFWQEKKTGREAEVAITGFNSLNDKHREHPLGDVIGSRVMGWLTLKF